MDENQKDVGVDAPVPIEEAKPDLEKERDARVIPVAQGILEDIAGQNTATDINDKSEFSNLIIKILNRALTADLNLTTDNSYAFQLVLGAYGAFNQVVMASKMAESQNVRYNAIAHEMMALFAKTNVPMGMSVTSEEQVKVLQVIQPDLEALFARENLTQLEISYILEGMMNALKVTEQVFSTSIQESVERMEAKILQIDNMTDLTMSKLNEVLMTDIDEILKVSAKTLS